MYRPLPDGLTIKNSPIEGLGLFATKAIKANSKVRDGIVGLCPAIEVERIRFYGTTPTVHNSLNTSSLTNISTVKVN